jgi:hypothetical protein
MYYNNVEYAMGRLNDTIVNSSKGPVYIKKVYDTTSVIEDTLCSVVYLQTEGSGRVKLTDIDLKPVELGWVNVGQDSSFMTRKPARRWRQGLSVDNISFLGGGGFMSFPFKEMFNTIMGIYPTIEDSKEFLKAWMKKVAFSRDFSLDKGKNLWYQGRIVGGWGETFNLNKPDQYLIQKLSNVVEEEVRR